MVLETNMPKTVKNKARSNHGFTIVELLIVIVVIGILAAITVVSYIGITQKANEASIKTEIKIAAKELSIYSVKYGSYPTTAGFSLATGWCPTAPNYNTDYCIKFGSGTTAFYTSGSSTSYELIFVKGNLIARVTESGSPTIVVPVPITAIAAISGATQVSQTLTAGALTPAAATASYQWKSATTSGGTYTNITGATNNTYLVTSDMVNKYLKVTATGTGIYTGTQTSVASSKITADPNFWIVIGSQTWARKNLNVGTMVNGAIIQTENSILEKYCYDNLESNCDTYGALYQWDEAMQYVTTEGTQGICPAGSHFPSDNDLKILEVQLGMTQLEANKQNNWRGTTQGTQLKPSGSSGMDIPLSGYRYSGGVFANISVNAYLWTSTEAGSNVWKRYLDTARADVYRSSNTKSNGLPVRCLVN